MALNCLSELKGFIVQFIRVVEIQFESASAETYIIAGTTAMPNGPKRTWYDLGRFRPPFKFTYCLHNFCCVSSA